MRESGPPRLARKPEAWGPNVGLAFRGGDGTIRRMAWRIDEEVIRGEIDCRVRGRVTGRIWLAGFAAPLELDLAGCPWRDLAGRTLAFSNPQPKIPAPGSRLALRQHGVVGDLTASRKRRVPDIPLEEIGEYYARRQPFPWHWANTIYLEWFSEINGRVVIETADFAIDVSLDATWSMTEEEALVQLQANAEAMGHFMARAAQVVELSLADDAGPIGEPDDEPPPDGAPKDDAPPS